MNGSIGKFALSFILILNLGVVGVLSAEIAASDANTDFVSCHSEVISESAHCPQCDDENFACIECHFACQGSTTYTFQPVGFGSASLTISGHSKNFVAGHYQSPSYPPHHPPPIS